MPRQHGPWTIRESNRVYHNPFIEVVEDRVIRPDGQPGIYGTGLDEAGGCHPSGR